MMAVGIGLCVNNARAVLEAIFNHRSEFVRTPKAGVQERTDPWRGIKYRSIRGLIPYLEIAFGAYYTWFLYDVLDQGLWITASFIVFFQAGFFYVGFMSLMQTSSRFARRAPPPLAPANV
jgi:hypothetical protein